MKTSSADFVCRPEGRFYAVVPRTFPAALWLKQHFRECMPTGNLIYYRRALLLRGGELGPALRVLRRHQFVVRFTSDAANLRQKIQFKTN